LSIFQTSSICGALLSRDACIHSRIELKGKTSTKNLYHSCLTPVERCLVCSAKQDCRRSCRTITAPSSLLAAFKLLTE
jgi:hypothetical protein